MRIGALLVALLLTAACGSGLLFRQYEYEEDIYLSLDGSATVYVNSSIAALNALRGTSFDSNPGAAVDRDAVRNYFSTPVSRVRGRVTTSQRNNRRFIHVRVDVDDVTRLAEAPVFSWSSYRFGRSGELFEYHQEVGAAAAGASASTAGSNWTGRELVAFRLHLPSKVVHQTAGPGNPKRGNILAWEQPLSARLRGVPVVLETRIESQSILYRTLWLFAATLAAVALMFVAIIWFVMRKSGKPQAT
jgi:hypothetical protein